MPSKKVSDADNQQERLRFVGWKIPINLRILRGHTPDLLKYFSRKIWSELYGDIENSTECGW
jgi:hypothetical protein